MASDCNDPKCYALNRHTATGVDGLNYTMVATDLWVERLSCTYTESVASAAGWLTTASVSNFRVGDWMEGGITRGHLEGYGCVPTTHAY